MRRNRTRRPRPSLRRPYFRPCLEELESRLAPSVDVLDWRGAVPGNNSGVNNQETQLTTANVNVNTFGQLFNDPVDGSIYGEPLVKTNVNINGVMHDVVYVATEHDSVYAFDADNPGPALWHVSFINPAQGINVVPNSVTGSGDIAPEIGISNTMMIDPTTGTLYTTAKTQDTVNGVNHYVITLYALNIATGAIENSTVIGDTTFINGTYTNTTNVSLPGTGQDSSNGVVTFNALRENERDGLFEDPATGLLYLTFTSHGDVTPVHGWILGYDPNTLQLKSVFNTTPDGGLGEIWMGEGMPAVDASGNIYAATGNGTFDAYTPGAAALGGGGGGLGYQGINNSLAVTFRAYDTSLPDNDSSSGLGENGNFLTPADITAASGINFNTSAHASTPDIYSATLAYDPSTQTLTETITDTTTGAVFNTSYNNVNLASLLGGNTGYVGFTGGTGGLNMEQDILTWTFGSNGTTTIDHSGGFASNSDLTANGNAKFTNGEAQLTPAANSQAGSIFETTAQDVSNGFTTTFTFKMVAGSNPVADGLTFTIENAQAGPDYGESVLRINPQASTNANGTGVNGGPALGIADSFTPFNFAALNSGDTDQGSGGVLLLPDDVGSAAHPHLMVQGGKDGNLYLLDRDNLGGFNPTTNNVVQELHGAYVGELDSTPAFLDLGGGNGLIYVMGSNDVLKAYEISNGVINPTPVARTSQVFGDKGASPFITTDPSGNNAIVWVLDNHLNGTNGAANGPSVLHAYNALTLQELYNSSQLGLADQLGGAVKFTVPTVANGHVYVPTQNGLYVFGLFPQATNPPAAPSNLTATAASSSSITLTWTNNDTDTRANKILRSTDGVNFTQIAEVNANATTFTDTGLSPSTTYYYEIVATNAAGDSAPSNVASAATLIAPPVLTVTGSTPSSVSLSWTATANQEYDVLRSTDGVNFTEVAALTPDMTTFTDTGLSPNNYYYKIEAIDQDGETAFSNVVFITVGQEVTVNHGNGFAVHDDLTANGSAKFVNGTAELTDGGGGEAGSIFTNQKVDIRQFLTTFSFQFTDGSSPPADGMTFIIQGNSPTALGPGGGGLGYGPTTAGSNTGGILNSLAIKFDIFNNNGEGTDSTGLFLNGDSPTTAVNPGDTLVDLTGTGINLSSGDLFNVSLSYDGSVLTETITDTVTGAIFSHAYAVNIQNLVHGETAYAGFGAGTGGDTVVTTITKWTFQPSGAVLPPLSPTNLKVQSVNADATNPNTSDVNLTWVSNSFNETGFDLERSTDGVNFTPIATLPPGTTSYTDMQLAAGTYYYRVRAFNNNGNSNYTNVDSVILGTPGQTVTVDHTTNGFANHSDLTSNGSNSFFTTSTGAVVDRLVNGSGGEAGSVFTTSRVGDANFSTTFTFQFHGGSTPPADGMAFVLQGVSPTALGPGGGGLGYGPDNPAAGNTGGIPNSLAIKFDIYSNAGEGTDSTGLFLNGDSPTIAVKPGDTLVDLTGTGINLSSGDVFKVFLNYDGTTLTEAILDTNTLALFATSYVVNIPAVIGGNVAYAGFTGGTGGLSVIADVQTWSYSFTEPTSSSGGSPTTPAAASPSAGGSAATSSTSTSGTGQAAPLTALASASSSTQRTNTLLMNPNPTPTVPNGSTNFVGNLSSLSSGWSAFQATTLGPIVRASDTPPPAPAMDPAPSELPALDQLFTDLGSGGSLDPLALDSGEIATT